MWLPLRPTVQCEIFNCAWNRLSTYKADVPQHTSTSPGVPASSIKGLLIVSFS